MTALLDREDTVVRPSPPESRSAPRRFAAARILFGLIWCIDATLKWLPGFRSGLLGMVKDSAAGQPSWLHPWFSFWTQTIGHSPSTFAILIALGETAVALSVVFGALQRVGFAFGAVLALTIWGVGEGFGGPYANGSTDIGCAVMYAVVFLALWLAVPRDIRAAAPGLDGRLSRVRALRWATFH